MPVTGSEKVIVKFMLVALVGFGSVRKMDNTVGESVTAGIVSYLPISGAEPLKSSLIPGIIAPWSIFGLDEVRVKLPLFGLVNSGFSSWLLHARAVAAHNSAVVV